MANSSGDSSDEFFDATDDLTSKNSDNEEQAPIWPTFSQPKLSQTIPPALPPPPVRNGSNNVPFLPAPPGIGTPRMRPSRAYQPQTPSREFPEPKLSNGGIP